MASDHVELEAGTGARPPRRLHRLAAASIVLGLLSLLPVAAVGAVVTGLWARRLIRRSQGRSWGSVPAVIGVGLGCIGLAVQGISAYRLAVLYREVTPMAEQFLTLVGNDQWLQTYDLFSPRHQGAYPLSAQRGRSHEGEMRHAFDRASQFRGLRWAFRFVPPVWRPGGDRVQVTYDVRFANERNRYTFVFVKTEKGWRIDEVKPG